MKGFFIEVSNDLLDPKHCQQMGDAVWLFMWFLDKMTVIDHDIGEGKVLGGKPIKYEDVKDDLGISRSTYIRWMEALRKEPYIKTLRTPYGQCITVLKAKKRFGRSVKNDTSVENRSSKNATSDPQEMEHHSHENDTSNKTITGDKSVRQKKNSAHSAEEEKQIGEVIFLFQDVNPTYKTLFNRNPQREASHRLLQQFGMEKLQPMIAYLKFSNGVKFAPTITTPVQLEQKMGELKAWADKQRGGMPGKGKKIIRATEKIT